MFFISLVSLHYTISPTAYRPLYFNVNTYHSIAHRFVPPAQHIKRMGVRSVCWGSQEAPSGKWKGNKCVYDDGWHNDKEVIIIRKFFKSQHLRMTLMFLAFAEHKFHEIMWHLFTRTPSHQQDFYWSTLTSEWLSENMANFEIITIKHSLCMYVYYY